MEKPVLISGIQPSGRLHIGNYLGALRHFVALQNSGEYRCYFFIADLHALIENPEPSDLKKNTGDLAASFFAVGLDPKKSAIFLQSQISAHEILAQIISTLTPVSELMRMAAFKEKILQRLDARAEKQISQKEFDALMEESNFGLAYYPVLMAADIILYDAKFVPVGEDQLQHLELARTLVRKFNKRFGKTFIEPKPLLTETPRVMSLNNPHKKMSKSSPNGCLFLDDSPKSITEKIMRAVTDSGREIIYKPEEKPALANLLRIYAALSDKLIPDIEQNFRGKGYSEFKKSLAGVVITHFAEYRKKKSALVKNPVALKRIVAQGSMIARKVAEKKMKEVRKKVGIVF